MTGKELKKAREARGIGVRELARLSKVSAATISDAETGKFNLRWSTIRKLTAALAKKPKLPEL